MKKIMTAMGNYTLNNELKRYDKYELNEQDLFYQEAVTDYLKEEKFDVLVVSSLLQGQLEFVDFINKVTNIDKTLRIIVVTDEINSGLKLELNEMGVTDIFLDSEIEISDITDAIDREIPLKKKYGLIKENNNNSYIVNQNIENKSQISEEYKKVEKEFKTKSNTIINNVTQRQEVIVVSGTNGAGKSTFAANFTKTLANKTESKVLLIDLDTLNGNIDEILEINKIPQNVEILLDENKKCGLNYAVELLSKNRFDANVFEELVINMGNIDVLTGNTSLHYCQNVLSTEHYKHILDCAKEKYDFIIIDTSSNIFLDSTKWALQQANRVFFITENNYISMKKAIQLINVFTENWKIWKEKIEIIINKENVNDIEIEIIKKILKDYEIIGKIKYGEEKLEYSYQRILETINYIPKSSFFAKLFENRYSEIFTPTRIPIRKINESKGVIKSVN